jgi:transcriptional regulator GlxA family with amidase domain
VTPSPHTVGILVFDGMKLLDFAGPAEVFAEANHFGGDYRISMVSIDGRDVRTSMGLTLPVGLAASDAGSFDTVLVAGGEVFPAGPVSESLASGAFDLSQRANRTGSICTGAFVLAASGLLEGKRATTHWQHTAELALRYPGILVERDAIFVKDGNTYSSAGVTAGIDLALALLEEDEGVELARTVARSLVVYLQRDGGQSQFSGATLEQVPRASLLRTVIDVVRADPSAEYSTSVLAEIASVSPRHLSRLFHEELGMTPAKYVEITRLNRAKQLLDDGRSVTEAAEASGFGSSETLRRAFVLHLAIPPSKYRGRFSSTAVKIRR